MVLTWFHSCCLLLKGQHFWWVSALWAISYQHHKALGERSRNMWVAVLLSYWKRKDILHLLFKELTAFVDPASLCLNIPIWKIRNSDPEGMPLNIPEKIWDIYYLLGSLLFILERLALKFTFSFHNTSEFQISNWINSKLSIFNRKGGKQEKMKCAMNNKMYHIDDFLRDLSFPGLESTRKVVDKFPEYTM